MTIPEVAHTNELQRIANLPRRTWQAADLDYLSSELSDILRTPRGTMRLRPDQALALHDAGTEQGGLLGLGTGEGKTIVSFLLPHVIPSERPLMLQPGGLIEKTQRARIELATHWRIPTHLRLFSYDALGRVQWEHELFKYRPDLLILEEGHEAKNLVASRSRRLARYMTEHPTTKVVVLSGTVMNKSIEDFWHLALWSLKERSPLPLLREEMREWAEALDVGIDPLARRRPGALLSFGGFDKDAPPDVQARQAFRNRLVQTPGVVMTRGEGEHVGASIYVHGVKHKVLERTEANFVKLRSEWKTPDDWPFDSGVDMWRHAQELALGLYYVWDPRPPEDWLQARRAWHKYVRDTISRSKKWDSEQHVADAVDAGHLKDGGILDAWRAIRPTFEANIVARWEDDSALEHCYHWMRKPGLVWTEHRLFAQRLAEFTGLPYYGQGGFDSAKRYIEDHKPETSAIASIDANSDGKNLQGIWSRCLYVCPPTSAKTWEQSISRLHRPGQAADAVEVDVLLGCRENYDAIQHAIVGSKAVRDMTGKTPKLLIADVSLPWAEIEAAGSARWRKSVDLDELGATYGLEGQGAYNEY